MSGGASADLHDWGVAELARRMAAAEVSSVEATTHLLQRAQAGSELGAWLCIDAEQALAAAARPTRAAPAATPRPARRADRAQGHLRDA